jgi:hypothetical protein
MGGFVVPLTSADEIGRMNEYWAHQGCVKN